MFLIKNFIYLLRIGVIKGAYRKFNFISEYLKVCDFFMDSSQKGFLNAILDKVSKVSRIDRV